MCVCVWWRERVCVCMHAHMLCPNFIDWEGGSGFHRGKSGWKWKVKVKLLSRVQLVVTLWTVSHQAPLSMGFSRQEYWSELPFPSAGDLPDPGIKPVSLASPALADVFFYYCATWENHLKIKDPQLHFQVHLERPQSLIIFFLLIEIPVYPCKIVLNNMGPHYPCPVPSKSST